MKLQAVARARILLNAMLLEIVKNLSKMNDATHVALPLSTAVIFCS
jgi:hypothetical protein